MPIPKSNIKEYKKYVKKRLSELMPALEKVSFGDFSARITIPEKEDEFTEISVFLNLMIEELKASKEATKRTEEEKIGILTKTKIELEKRVKKRTVEFEKQAEELNSSKRALMNILEDVEKARSETEEEKNKTLTIINNLVDGLLVFDSENRLSLVNPQVENLFGLKEKDMIGKTIFELSIFPTVEPLINLIGKEIKREIFKKEIKIKENLTLEVTAVPVMIEGGKGLINLIILHDITREKVVERMKTEFVSVAAHQLRTPLSAIKWTLKMLLDEDLGKITPEQREFLQKTYTSNERMISLINDLLDVTRIEEGKHIYKPILTKIESIIQFVVNSYREGAERKKIKIIFKKTEEKLPKIVIDVEKIKLAIQNLLDNAIKYTPQGGTVTILLKRGKKEIIISIKDTGVGIPKDQQDRVFSKFFRGANAIRMETEGSGLGLFIAKNIIETHGGKIWFESLENKGTNFYFTLPVKEELGEFLKEF